MQLTITWFNTPHATAEVRAELTKRITELPPASKRQRRASYAAARARMERRGDARLAAPVASAPAARAHMLRLYYRSEGGEILCCESLHTRADAYALGWTHRGPGSNAVDAECWRVGEPRPELQYGARLVVLPSQMDTPSAWSHPRVYSPPVARAA